MSNLPAWKRALLEKKKQQEQQEEIKKRQEQDAYIKSLPPWKRAIVMRDLEKNKSSTTASQPTGNAPTSISAQPQDKWKAPRSPVPQRSESPARNRVAWGGSGGGVRGSVSNQNNAESGNPSWLREKSPTSPAVDPNPTAGDSSEDASSPKMMVREERRGSVQLLKDQFKASSPPPSTRSLQQQGSKQPATESKSVPPAAQTVKRDVTPPQQQAAKVASPKPTRSTPASATAPAVAQVDDSDLAGLPSWKRALILKKRQKQAGLVPGANTQPQSGSVDTTSTSSEQSKPNEPPSDAPDITKKESTAKSRPDVVNRGNENDNPGSNKLVQKEGVSLHPPIFNEVGQWANVAADDPKFTQLPQWKQALILRRRKDIAKRSGQETSPPGSPTVKTAADKRRASSPSSNSQAETKKGGSKKATAKSTGKTEGKKTSKSKATEDKKTTTSKSTNKSKVKTGEQKTTKTVKANANKAKAGSTAGKQGSGGIKPVRSAPTKPPEKKKVEEEKKEEKEEPMFTWNFSKNSMDTGDAMSNSSDSELEDVQITSIDDELTDEDDSGIGGGGGTILKSYKPLADTSEIEERSVTPERRERSLTPERKERSVTPEKKEDRLAPPKTMTNSTSDPTISKIPRSESKPILIDPAKKPYKSLRRVSFSDSNLETEHFYPKYDYSDYEDIEQALPDIFGRSKLRNAGLSHRLHPSLRTDTDTSSDTYRYGGGFSSNPGSSNPGPSSSSAPQGAPESPATNGMLGGSGLSSYTPSMLSPFDAFSASPISSPIKEEETTSGDTEVEQVDGNSADDYYSSLNADTAALLW